MIKALGGVVVEGDQAAIVLERFYPQPVEDVWRAITEPDQLGVWFGPVVLDPRLGGAIATEAGPLDVPVELRRSVGEILEWEPPHVFAYEWRQALVEPSTLRYELHAAGEGTRLQLDHRWLSPQNARGFIPGQHVYLDRLAAHLNGEPLPDWRTHYAAVLPAVSAWPSPQVSGATMTTQVNPAVEQMLARWHELVAQRDMRNLPELLHADVVFRSPFAHTPYVGTAKVAALLGTVIQVFEDFVYERQFVAQDSAALEFRARVGKLSLKGIDLIRCDAQGQIVEFEVMIRPANALLALGEEMGKRLAAQGVVAG